MFSKEVCAFIEKIDYLNGHIFFHSYKLIDVIGEFIYNYQSGKISISFDELEDSFNYICKKLKSDWSIREGYDRYFVFVCSTLTCKVKDETFENLREYCLKYYKDWNFYHRELESLENWLVMLDGGSLLSKFTSSIHSNKSSIWNQIDIFSKDPEDIYNVIETYINSIDRNKYFIFPSAKLFFDALVVGSINYYDFNMFLSEGFLNFLNYAVVKKDCTFIANFARKITSPEDASIAFKIAKIHNKEIELIEALFYWDVDLRYFIDYITEESVQREPKRVLKQLSFKMPLLLTKKFDPNLPDLKNILRKEEMIANVLAKQGSNMTQIRGRRANINIIQSESAPISSSQYMWELPF